MRRVSGHQIQAPRETKNGPNLSPEEKRRLDCWAEEDGWCSACGEGRYPVERICPVVHLGKRDGGPNFALCGTCVERMRDILRAGRRRKAAPQ